MEILRNSRGVVTGESARTISVRRLASIFVALLAVLPARGQQTPPLREIATVRLPNVQGRIDHFGIDLKGHRLFMSALGSNAVEVFDLLSYTRLHSISGLSEPQGVSYAAASNKLFVANGGDGSVRIFDGASYQQVGILRLPSDADDTRYDAAAGRVFVGYGEGGIAALDAATGKLLDEVTVEGHPEAFEVQNGGKRVYINLPARRAVVVADLNSHRVVARWPLGGFRANFPMAIHARGHRLFVVTRRPARLLVFDSDSGKVVDHLPVVGDADDVWYDAKRGRIYVTGGEGFITVIKQHDPEHYAFESRITTSVGARTSFYSPELDRLFVAVPRHAGRSAELRVYRAGP